VTPGWHWDFIFSLVRYGELPVITIVLSSVAGWMLGMRNMMITMIAEDFVLMASPRVCRVARSSCTRRAMPCCRASPTCRWRSGSWSRGVVVELVFNYPGVGNLLLQAVLNEDYPLIQGISWSSR